MKRINIENIIYFLVCLYFLDIIVFGTGVITRIGFISTRIIIGIMAVIISLPIVIKKMKSKYVIMLVGFLSILLIGFIRGIINSNSYSIIKSDISGFAHILIILPMMCCLNSEQRIIKLIKIFSHTLSIFAITTIVLTFYCMFPENISSGIYTLLDTYGLGGITVLSGNAVRIFWHTSSRLFIVAFMYYLIMYVTNTNSRKISILAMSINLVATFVSYTRSLYFGILIAFGIAIIMVLLFCSGEAVKLFRCVGISVAMSAVMLSALGLVQQTNLFSVAIDRCLIAEGFFDNVQNIQLNQSTEGLLDNVLDNAYDSSEEKYNDGSSGINFNNNKSEILSVSIRTQRQELAIENISKNILFGCGLGTINDPNGEPIELFYLDILSKIGVTGLAAFLVPYACVLYDFCTKRYGKVQRFVLLACIVAVSYAMSFSYFNPFMNSAVGLSLYSLCISQTFVWEDDKQ